MRAIIIKEFGASDKLQETEYPLPTPGTGEVRIKVKAAGVNRADIAQRKGHYPAPKGVPSDIPGLEISGVVESCGPNVSWWEKGDAVCALLSGGGYAEYVIVKEGQCLPLPRSLNFIQGAALPEAVYTVWHNAFMTGRLKAGEHFLIHGGSSGIGTTAIQLAYSFGVRTYVTVGSEEKGKVCLNLGARQFINYKTQDFEKELKTEGMDLILDMVGGDYLNKNIHILNQEGRLIYINSMKGKGDCLDIFQLMQKEILLTGSTLRSRDYLFKKNLSESIFHNLWPIIESGKFRPVIARVFPFSQASKAHQLMESSLHIGKIILSDETF